VPPVKQQVRRALRRRFLPDRPAPPHFIGVGTQRSGTTWWDRMVQRHPQITKGNLRRKELHFFDEFCSRAMTDADVRRYHEIFARNRRSRLVYGEWTPRYSYDAWVPRLLARAAPDAKLLFMVRDPVERFRSGLAHQLHVAPHRRKPVAANDGIDRGRYATQLKRLHEFFPREQVLVIQYEQCRQDPVAQYARTMSFLGVDPAFSPGDFFELQGATTGPKKLTLWPDLEEALRETYAPEYAELEVLAPDLDLSLWRSAVRA